MDSIIRLDARGNIIIEPAAAKLVPLLATLDEKQIRYLVLAHDTSNTVFKQQSRKEWRTLACEQVYGHRNPDKAESLAPIPKILDIFKALVYDEEREKKTKITTRKRELEDKLFTVEGTAAMKPILESITMLDKMLIDIEAKIAYSDEEVILANKNGKLSMIEKWQRKMKALAQ